MLACSSESRARHGQPARPAALRRLPATFRYSHVQPVLTERQCRHLLEHGLITRVARSVYRKSGAHEGHELIEVVTVRPRTTLCLRSALAFHGLLDENPDRHHLALLRGTRPLDTTVPVAWHLFDRATFDLGRTTIRLDATTRIGYTARYATVIDAFRLREQEGPELGHAALRRWLARGGRPARLQRLAARFRRVCRAFIRRSRSCSRSPAR